MMRWPYASCSVLLALAFSLTASLNAQGTRSDYERANHLREHVRDKVFKASIEPHWFADNTRFWYRNDLPGKAREFIVVDAVGRTRQPAFDHARLAAGLSEATGEHCTATHLPVDRIEFIKGEQAVRLAVGEQGWKCDLAGYTLTKGELPPKPEKPERPRRNRGRRGNRRPSNRKEESPDGKWTVVVKDNDLYLKEKETEELHRLSHNGKPGYTYDARVLWSPDSTKLVALWTKEEPERKVYLIESSPKDQLQPKLHTIKYRKPGDAMPNVKPVLFDIEQRKRIAIDDWLFSNPWSIRRLRFAPDGSRFTFTYNQRGHQVLRIIAVDAETGTARAIVDETSPTFIDYAYKQFTHYVDETDELIWMSERDGWNHLYLYDAETGKVKNQITRGPWVVRGVERVDDAERVIWFRASGIYPDQDPYSIHYCRINFDDSGLLILTEGDGTHSIAYSPDRRFFVDTYSRVDLPPVTQLRRTEDGKLVFGLENADIGPLREAGWSAPERFVAKGRDGKTDIHGVIFRPTTFDATRRYPVIEKIYAGPHGSFVPKAFAAYHSAQAMAELGFIVVQIDGMGTSNRSKPFHDVCWKNLGDSGFPDRILWIKAAAEKYPYMDITRVGIYGGSAGGQSATRGVLAFGVFYKAAVSDCGCHDNRMDKIWWNELWMGWPIGPHYAEQSNVTNAHKLQGKLMLIVAELDHNVDPASTMQVVDALIKADKDFDLLVIPGSGHGIGGAYGIRRRRDFFVRHLLGVEPRSEP